MRWNERNQQEGKRGISDFVREFDKGIFGWTRDVEGEGIEGAEIVEDKREFDGWEKSFFVLFDPVADSSPVKFAWSGCQHKQQIVCEIES